MADDDDSTPPAPPAMIDPARIVHLIENDDHRSMRVVVELRRPLRRVFDATLPADVTDDELADLLGEVLRILQRRRRDSH